MMLIFYFLGFWVARGVGWGVHFDRVFCSSSIKSPTDRDFIMVGMSQKMDDFLKFIHTVRPVFICYYFTMRSL
jgi:hypothetical protein